MAKVKTSA